MENKKPSQKNKKFSKEKGRILTVAVFLIAIYGVLFGMAAKKKDIVDAFWASYKETSGNPLDKTAAGISSAETAINKSIIAKKKLIDVYGLFQVMLCRKEIEAGSKESYVYKMDNGQLTFAYPSYKTSGIIKQFVGLQQVCDAQGTKLLYVQWPFKVDKYNNLLPHGKEDYANKNADSLIAGLCENGIATLD